MYDIFISYRRKCRSEELALILYEKLTQDGYAVSHDHSTFYNSKLPFDITIEKRIEECTDFVCIIGQDTFERCESPNYNINEDWIAYEILCAIKKKKNIIPVRLDVEDFPKNIPNVIENEGFTRYNSPKYSADYFEAFYEKLKEAFVTSNPLVDNADAQFEKALYSFKLGKNLEAMELLLEAAKKGSPGACCKLGELYIRSNNGELWNVKYDLKNGISWLNKALKMDYPAAYFELGWLYLRGLGIPKNPEKAIELFHQGVKLGDGDCMNELGLCYLNGTKVLQDDYKAAELFKCSADSGNAKGMLNYAMCCREGRGVQQDIEKYFRYVKTAALLDLPKAHHYLACAYFTGEGISKNLEKAFCEFEKAYNLGELDDGLNLALCYEHGYGTMIDLNRAIDLLKTCMTESKEKKRYDLEAEAHARLISILNRM